MEKSQTALSPEEIRERLKPLFGDQELKLIILFGSTASGTMHKKSDIDLALLFDGPVDSLILTNKINRILRTDKVDVVDLRRASPLLRFCAARQGKAIYERAPGLFSEFCSLSFRMYVDTKKLRDAQAQAIRHFLKERGLA
ncbi:MAG TPA: hypothetical protein DCP92_19615 [Nitrospiraceae bacterium]|jgi:predicted nucleotidyltransferase|nr:hypothetical protein [Nitrospiraceae bacterium]